MKHTPNAQNVAATSIKPVVSVNGSGYFNSFTAGGTGTFSATTPATTTTPEPATVVPFILGGLGLMTLIVRKNRKASSVTA